MQQHSRNFIQQSLTLGLAMFPQSSGNCLQILVVVARVAEQLKGALGRNMLEQGAQFGGVQAAGGGNAERSVGGETGRNDAMEAGAEAVEKEDLKAALHACMPSAVRWLKGVTQRSHRCDLHGAKKGTRDRRKDVGMLVRVQVRDADAGALNLANLGQDLAFNLFLPDSPHQEITDKVGQFGAKGPLIGAEQGGDRLRRGYGNAVGEDDMAADAEAGKGVRDTDSVVEGRPVGHERC